MYELFVRIETLLSPLSVPILLGVGLPMLLVGLVLWLGGSRHSTVIIGLLGAVVGSVAGITISQRFDLHLWLCMAGGAAVLATASVFLRNLLVLVLAVVVIAAVSGAGYLAVLLDRVAPAQDETTAESRSSTGLLIGVPNASFRVGGPFQSFTSMDPNARLSYLNELAESRTGQVRASRPQSVVSGEVQLFHFADPNTGQDYAVSLKVQASFRDRVRAVIDNTWTVVEPHAWKAVLAVLAGGIVAIFLVWLVKKALIALAYSVVGAATILLGVQTALLGAGIAVVSGIGPRPWVLPGTFLGMTAIGWLWQLIMSGPKAAKHEHHHEHAHEHHESDE
ncbi:MAG: hypothetical protein ABFE13_00520 [Phycisphaerales bacterium]